MLTQLKNYYAFGMAYEGSWQVNDGAKDNPYQYNGKELNTDHGLNWSDYGARWYDACVGRWSSVDPMTETQESWTPYHFNYSSPLNFIDYFGLEPEYQQNIEICPTCPSDSKFDPERESKDTYVYEPESGTTYLEGTEVTITASSSESSSMYPFYNQFISTAGKAGDYIDPWLGTTALHISSQLSKQLQYHSFTKGERFPCLTIGLHPWPGIVQSAPSQQALSPSWSPTPGRC